VDDRDEAPALNNAASQPGPRWDEALQGLAGPPSLLQSWSWGDVQAQEGWEAERLLLPSGGRALALCQGAGRLRWAYVARGPVPATSETLSELAGWARDRRLARLRVEPEAGQELAAALTGQGFVPAPARQPEHTLVVPLGDEAEMLAACKPKHRYNIRLAAKRGVGVEVGADAEEMWRQSQGTAERQEISLLSPEQYRRRLTLLGDCRTYVARHEGEALAAIMVARFAGRAYYLYGGAIGRQLQLMPTYAVQWAAMLDAARAGCRDYDLWGVPPGPDDATHPWHGLWQFKSGFGGEMVDYCGAWDLVLSPWAARWNGVAEDVRRAARRLGALSRR
jgi:lipid II:glycine glycyltransferase (peptidoglycan interpeptide bridge formation enzyme)